MKIQLRLPVILMLITILFSSEVLSQDIDTTRFKQALKMSFEDLLQIKIVTASKTKRSSSQITQIVDVVSKYHFDRIVADKRNITEYIQYLPGAAVKVLSRNDANWGAYGGIGPKYNTFMLGGLPLDAFIDPQSIDIMAIDRIEIQRGPASVLYPNYLSQDFSGNQSPLAGTVNLILKDDIERAMTKISLDYGSYNTCRGQVYHENKINQLSFFAGLSYEASDYTNYGSEDSWLNMLDDPSYKKIKGFVGGTLDLDQSKNHQLSFWGNQTFHWGNLGRDNRDYDYKYSLFNFKYSGKLTDKIELLFKSGVRWYKREWEEDAFVDPPGDYELAKNTGVDQTIIPNDLSINIDHLDNSNLTVGVDYQHASYSTWDQPKAQTKTIKNDALVSQLGFYAQEELHLDKLTLRGGLRLNMIRYNIDRVGGDIPGEEEKSWDKYLWSAGAKYRFSEKFILFSNAGSSFMSPSLKSIAGTIPLSAMYVPGQNGQLPNPDLNPEKGLGFDLGINSQLFGVLYLNIRAFYTKITNAIIDNAVSEDPSQTQSMNAGGETIGQGFEISMHQKIKDEIEWFANLTYTDSKIDDPDDNDKDGTEVPFVPELVSNFGITANIAGNVSLSSWVHFGGKIYDSSSKENRKSFRSKELVNLLISKGFRLKNNDELQVFIKAYNITNNKYEMPWQFRDPGFNLTFGASVSF